MQKIRMQDVLWFVGRAALAAPFLSAGYNKLRFPEETKQYMASKRLPLVAVLRPLAASVEMGSALSLISGFRRRWGASAALLFLATTTAIFHDFWRLQGEERETQLINFLKNLAVIGGLLHVAAVEPSRRREAAIGEYGRPSAARYRAA